jgi:hypothetical protein
VILTHEFHLWWKITWTYFFRLCLYPLLQDLPATSFVGVGASVDVTYLNAKNRRYTASISSCSDAGTAVPNYAIGYWYNECGEVRASLQFSIFCRIAVFLL